MPVSAQSDFEAIKARADAGDTQAQYELGQLYYIGEVVAQNYPEAVKWLTLAAERGLVEAIHDIGTAYLNGFYGVAQNDQKAFKWYRQAAELEFAHSQYMLGVMYASGRAVSLNHYEALNWYRLAAVQGFYYAQLHLGRIYENGEGVPQNFTRAYIWYSLADSTQPRGTELPLVSGASVSRDRVAAKLSQQALEQAQALATRCFESNFQDCD